MGEVVKPDSAEIIVTFARRLRLRCSIATQFGVTISLVYGSVLILFACFRGFCNHITASGFNCNHTVAQGFKLYRETLAIRISSALSRDRALTEASMRKLGIAIAVIVVLLVAAVLIVPHLIDVNQFHGQIQSQLEKRLGRQVTLGKMALRLFPPAFDVENATIAEDPHFASNRPFATADKLAVSVKFWPLLQKQLDVNSLELVRPHIELVRNAEGVWNFATLGQQSKPSAARKLPRILHKLPRQPRPPDRQARLPHPRNQRISSLRASLPWQNYSSMMDKLPLLTCRSTSPARSMTILI